MRVIFFILFFGFQTYSQNNCEVAMRYFEQKKYAEAKEIFEKCLVKNPSDLQVLESLGDIAGHQKKWDVALRYYTKLRDLFPKNANYWYKYGGALGMKAKESNKFKAIGMVGDVRDAFLTAAKLDPKHIESRWALVVFYIELPGILGGSESKAKQYAAELMNLSKVDGYLSKGYIEVYYKRYQNAENYYVKAHEIGHSKTTFEKLYDLYLNKLKDTSKAQKLKQEFTT